ncbi:PKD domain-containing protein, partial [Cutibacterium acnes]
SGLAVTFDASASTDPDGAVTGASWDFGDGTTASGLNVSHVYATEGVYVVTLRVTDDSGASGTEAQYVGVGAAVEPPSDAYGAAVFGDAPVLYWQFEETDGTTAADSGTGRLPGQYQQGVTLAVQGIRLQRAAGFDGLGAKVVAATQVNGPATYSEEIWFSTTSTSGGKLIGFGNASSGMSSNYDRHVYLRDDGRLVFGVWTGSATIAVSPAAYNDGAWHHVVA